MTLPDGREATALTVIHSSKEPSTSVQQNMHRKVQNALQVRSREIFLVKPEIKSTEFVKISIRIEQQKHNLADNYNYDRSNKDTDMYCQLITTSCYNFRILSKLRSVYSL